MVLLLGAFPLGVESARGPSGAPNEVRLMIGGDVMLDNGLSGVVQRFPRRPFRDVRPLFDQADLVLVNLECVISDRGTPDDKNFRFRAPLRAADALRRGGIDVVSLANNHALDYGWDALRQTRRLLRQQGIAFFGAGADADAAHAPTLIERNGLTIAFLGYLDLIQASARWSATEWEADEDTPGLAISRAGQVARDVAAARGRADVVVVMFHFGVEGSATPSQRQRRLSRVALDAGAALIVGAHPHVLQGVRQDATTFVAYSLGNFVFDGFEGRYDDSVILDVTLTAAGVSEVRYHPVVDDPHFPRPANAEESARIMRRLAPVP